jgi:hypothetical protein
MTPRRLTSFFIDEGLSTGIDGAVIAKVGNILSDDLATFIVEEVRRQLAPEGAESRHVKLMKEIEGVDWQMVNLADAVAMGGGVPALGARIKQAEERRRQLGIERDQIEGATPIVRVDWRPVEREVRQRLAWGTRARSHRGAPSARVDPRRTAPLHARHGTGPTRLPVRECGAPWKSAFWRNFCEHVKSSWRPRMGSVCRWRPERAVFW